MSDDEPYSIHRQAGMDEADAVTALVKMDRENRVAAIRRLFQEVDPIELTMVYQDGDFPIPVVDAVLEMFKRRVEAGTW